MKGCDKSEGLSVKYDAGKFWIQFAVSTQVLHFIGRIDPMQL